MKLSRKLKKKVRNSENSGVYPNAGYTPNNLKWYMRVMRLKRMHIADICGVQASAVTKWCAEPSSENHRTMPLKQWQKLMNEKRCLTCIHYVTLNDSCDEANIPAGYGDISYSCKKHEAF